MQYKISIYPKVFLLIIFLGIYVGHSEWSNSVCFFQHNFKTEKVLKVVLRNDSNFNLNLWLYNIIPENSAYSSAL